MQDIAKKIRKDILKESYKSGACHIGSALSCVEILIQLYYNILEKDDTFIFSKASGVATLYVILADKGYFPKNKIARYLKNYPLASKEVPGVIHSVGSLGHGLPVAAGLALANRDKKVYCLMSDGELDEGTTWETAMFAAHHNLSNLRIIIDRNEFQACGATEAILKLEPLEDKFKAFGWEVKRINGHNLDEIESVFHKKFYSDALEEGYTEIQYDKPLCVIADTIKGKGVSFMERDFNWHYKNLDERLLNEALKELL